jgi:HEAT repeat protein
MLTTIARNLGSTMQSCLWILTVLLLAAPQGWAELAAEAPANAAIRKLSDKRETPEVREKAAQTLGHLVPPSEAAVHVLAEAIRDKTAEGQVRRAAINALAAIGRQPGESDQAIVSIVKILGDRHSADSLRAAAARALGKIFQNSGQADVMGQAIPVLVDALTRPDTDPIVRANAAWSLGQIGVTVPEDDHNERIETVKALIEAVKTTHVNVGQTAAQSLVKMYKTSVPELTRKLTDNDDASFRWNVAWIVGEIGKDARDAVPALTELLKNSEEDPNLRGAAAWAIGKIGREAKTVTLNFQDTVFALTEALTNTDNDPNVRSNAAWALGRIGPEVKEDRARFPDKVAAALGDALNDIDPDIRRNAAWALGQIKSDPRKVLSRLADALRDDDPRVRAEAAGALGLIGHIGEDTDGRVQVLAARLEQDDEPTVRMLIAGALGLIGSHAQSAIPQLVNASHRPNSHSGKARDESKNARRAAAEALVKIADALQAEGKADAIDQLEGVAAALNEREYRSYAAQIRSGVRNLRSLLWINRTKRVLNWIQRYRLPAFAIFAYVLFWLLLYWKRPYLIFRINEALKPYAGYKLPKFIGGIPLSYLILGGIFHYRARVLDAWVAAYVGAARKKFEKKSTVNQREVHVELPALLDGTGIPALNAANLQSCFEKKRNCVLICGEGGAGKTSLACQICKWAMSDDPSMRLSKHPMLAVLLELENLEAGNGEDILIEAVRTELCYLIDPVDPPSLELVKKLLENRRILVVVDGFSEMREVDRNKLRPGSAEFAARALVITSRLEEKLAGVDFTLIKPMRVQGDHLSTFMDAYLVQRNKKDLFTDEEYFHDLGKLSKMVREREITVLLARLYAEQMIAGKECHSKDKLPENVPGLILEYLNQLNRKVMTKLEDRVVHRVAKTIAWECLRETYRPMSARIDSVVQLLDGQAAASEDQIRFLERSLRVVQTIGPARDRIRFTLDPLAEYLAALKITEDLAENEQDWRDFLAAADVVRGAPVTIKGFLLALRDCCLVSGADLGIPDFVCDELGERLGLNTRGEEDGTTKPEADRFVA